MPARPLRAAVDSKRRRPCARARGPPDAIRPGGFRSAHDRGCGCARFCGQPAARGSRSTPRRPGADGRDRRLIEHARILEHDREVAAHARQRSFTTGRAGPCLAERVPRPSARDAGLGAPRLAADDRLHQRAEPQARRPGEARPDAAPQPRARRLPVGWGLHGWHPALERSGAGDAGAARVGHPRMGRSSSSATFATHRKTSRASGC